MTPSLPAPREETPRGSAPGRPPLRGKTPASRGHFRASPGARFAAEGQFRGSAQGLGSSEPLTSGATSRFAGRCSSGLGPDPALPGGSGSAGRRSSGLCSGPGSGSGSGSAEKRTPGSAPGPPLRGNTPAPQGAAPPGFARTPLRGGGGHVVGFPAAVRGFAPHSPLRGNDARLAGHNARFARSGTSGLRPGAAATGPAWAGGVPGRSGRPVRPRAPGPGAQHPPVTTGRPERCRGGVPRRGAPRESRFRIPEETVEGWTVPEQGGSP